MVFIKFRSCRTTMRIKILQICFVACAMHTLQCTGDASMTSKELNDLMGPTAEDEKPTIAFCALKENCITWDKNEGHNSVSDRVLTSCPKGEVPCLDVMQVSTEPSKVTDDVSYSEKTEDVSGSEGTEEPNKMKLEGCGVQGSLDYGDVVRQLHDYDKASLGEYPWVVKVHRKPKEYVCVGSLINPRVVLTVANRFRKRKNRRNLFITAGTLNRDIKNNNVNNVQISDVQDVKPHPNYDPGEFSNDAALLILKEEVNSSPSVQFVCLPQESLVPSPGTNCFMAGWGATTFGGELVDFQKIVEVPIVDNDTCQKALRSAPHFNVNYKIPPSMMCAGGEQDTDACRGDGGAPLVCKYSENSNRFYQAGIVSWGMKCGVQGRPGVYTSVATMRRWIDEIMDENAISTESYIPPGEDS